MRPPGIHALRYSYKLAFDYTHNEVEYEVMILEILDFKKVQVRRVVLSGVSEMVINKITEKYQVRHPR